MKFVIITHVPHFAFGDTYQGYSAYIREMNIWAKYVDELLIVAPLSKEEITSIHLPYHHKNIRLYQIPAMSFTSPFNALKTIWNLPRISWQIFRAMKRGTHLHLRCPGTIGLVGCLVQILFPNKKKTAKYAGNWDPKAKQPFSYKLQKRLLSNTVLTRNMKVLVYGKWPNQTRNILPFFTATYGNSKVAGIVRREFNTPYKFMFVGTLSPGKQPNYAIRLMASLREKGVSCTMDFYGEGTERDSMELNIKELQLEEVVVLHGNQTSEVVENAYKNAHFLMLPSLSEGWPKVLAEAMFWGCIPVATRVSCVPWMLGNGERGILLGDDYTKNVDQLLDILNSRDQLNKMAMVGQEWSHSYTLDRFEGEIKELLK
ncbi:MAG: glycosyltransferase [Aureisphaera sp.]